MRRALALAAALLPCTALAQTAPAAAPAAAAAPTPDQQIEALRQRLLSAQQTIATLERQLATAKDKAVLADQCKVKNGKLVYIARELIEGYEKRYQMGHRDPLQLGRRRFEFELQALSDAVYDNRAEVPVKLPGEAPAPAKPAADAAPATGH